MAKLTDLYKNEGDVPEALKDYYVKTDDGWVPDGVDSELKASNKRFRTENIQQRKNFEALEDKFNTMKDQFKDIDPEEYSKHIEMINQIKEDEVKTLMKQGKFDEVVQRRTAAVIEDTKKQLKAKDDALLKSQENGESLKSKLGELLIDRDIQLEVSKSKLNLETGALPYLLDKGRKTWHIDEKGEQVPTEKDPVTGKRQTRYGKDGNPITKAEWMAETLVSSPFLFKPATGGGGPGKDQDGISRPGQKKTVDMSDPVAFGQNLEDIAKGTVKDANE